MISRIVSALVEPAPVVVEADSLAIEVDRFLNVQEGLLLASDQIEDKSNTENKRSSKSMADSKAVLRLGPLSQSLLSTKVSDLLMDTSSFSVNLAYLLLCQQKLFSLLLFVELSLFSSCFH
ncbi:hypothetical protein Tco_0425913 [Tanacetum coccineum]